MIQTTIQELSQSLPYVTFQLTNLLISLGYVRISTGCVLVPLHEKRQIATRRKCFACSSQHNSIDVGRLSFEMINHFQKFFAHVRPKHVQLLREIKRNDCDTIIMFFVQDLGKAILDTFDDGVSDRGNTR